MRGLLISVVKIIKKGRNFSEIAWTKNNCLREAEILKDMSDFGLQFTIIPPDVCSFPQHDSDYPNYSN